MRAWIAGFLLATLLTIGGAPAWAESLSVLVDIPVVYKFNEESLTSAKPSGIVLGVALPFLIGVAAEIYTVKGAVTQTPPNSDFEYKATLVDVFLNLPFPAGNLKLGAGLGKGALSTTPPKVTFPDGKLVQVFFSIGVSFAKVFDAHVGYHVIRGETDIPAILGLPGKLNLDASMATIGIKVGF